MFEIFHVASSITQVENALLGTYVELIGRNDFERWIPSITLCIHQQEYHEFGSSYCLDEQIGASHHLQQDQTLCACYRQDFVDVLQEAMTVQTHVSWIENVAIDVGHHKNLGLLGEFIASDASIFPFTFLNVV